MRPILTYLFFSALLLCITIQLLVETSARKLVVYRTDGRDVVLRHPVVQFCTMTLSIGLLYITVQLLVQTSARKRVVYHTDGCDVVYHCPVVQFFMMTLSIGLMYCQQVQVVYLICCVTVLFGCRVSGVNFLLALLDLRVYTLLQGF